MSSNLAILPEPEPLRAVTVSRDVQEFDLLIEDMEAELGEAWGDLTFAEAGAFLAQDEAKKLEFIVLALDQQDEAALPRAHELVGQAKAAGLKVILVAEGLGPMALHELLRAGADDFAPYPLPQDALSEAVSRIRIPGQPDSEGIMRRAGADIVDAAAVGDDAETPNLPAMPMRSGGSGQEGAVFALQSASGGDGATTLAVNLAWEFANLNAADPLKVCVIDLGLQFGSVATYLDLPRKPMIYEVLSDIASMDEQAFRQALSVYKDKLAVFTAPSDVLPYDLVGPEEVTALLKFARECFDIVIVDMPGSVTGWTDTVISTAELFFVVCQMEVRSAQNALRFQRLLQAEGVPTERVSYLLNRAPGKMDLGGRSRIEKMAESLGVKFHHVLPDGGKQVTEVNDQAAPLRDLAPRNALTKEIRAVATELNDARQRIAAGEDVGAGAKGKKRSFLGLSFG
ncbi:AAA family ATPase [Jannaschia ovalis]|uniref:AAA family ATPase n=1 Tax=Jannaschia ovalis TaxID=3038773 RepID=A0ABY8LGL3_9RHOB|nr:AAA family ATPase [Jannaschia sp. GRR-S6-38]WGH80439.1 AAA family ATPase [Jannaschia sp. GRR-S6-38]